MKILIKYLIIYFSFCWLLSSCYKYPNGGWSNRASRHLLSSNEADGKKWNLVSYKVNNVDSLNTYKERISKFLGANLNFEFITFTTFKNGFDCLGIVSYRCKFSNSKNQSISFKSEAVNSRCIPYCIFALFDPLNTKEEIIWKITKLTENQFWATYANQNSYEVKFVPQ